MDFIRSMVARDLATGKYDGRVVTRFPPEPNGFLHIGHAKSICLNFGIAAEHPGGRCNLRLDDTNPDTEKAEYVEAMKRDIRWLGFDWGKRLYHASDYFEELYGFALVLVDKGLAYVDSSSEAEIRERRGSVTRPGANSPYRDRTVEENRELFRRMRAGEYPDGRHVLRAKIDMAHPNMVMRDPILYRIRHASHYRHGDRWPIYPMYDFAHCLSDSLERITHSLCTLEFDNNRAIYDWLLEHVDAPSPRPEQTEFAPLVLDYVVTSKRRLRRLVEEGRVRGWDDPRMPTLAGLRRRGVTASAIRSLCEMVGVAKVNSRVDPGKLDYAVRNDLNRVAPRAFCVLDPLKVVLTNWPEGKEESLTAPCFPPDVVGPDMEKPGAERPEAEMFDSEKPVAGGPVADAGGSHAGTPKARTLPFGRVVCIDHDDFREEPPSGFRRLSPGRWVRLKHAGLIRCDSVEIDPDSGRPAQLRCTFEPEVVDGHGARERGRRVTGTLHWVSARHAVPAEVRLYDRLFTTPDPLAEADFMDTLNPDSEQVASGAFLEPSLAGAPPGARYQFERLGYFFADPEDSRPGRLVFNRTVPLRDGWARRAAEATGGRATRQSRTRPSERTTHRSVAPPSSRRGDPPSQSRTPPGGRTGDPPEPTAAPKQPVAVPVENRARFDELGSLGVPEAAAASLARSPRLDAVFRAALPCYPRGAGAIASWVVNEVAGLSADHDAGPARLDPAALAALARAVDEGSLSRRQGRAVLSALLAKGGTFEQVRASLDLAEIADEGVLGPLLGKIVRENPEKAAAYRDGRTGLLGFFVGEAMKRSGGKADPRAVSRLAAKMLGERGASP